MKLKLNLLLVILFLTGCNNSTNGIAVINDIPISEEALANQVLLMKLNYEINGLTLPSENERIDIQEKARDKIIEDFILVDIAKNKGIEIDENKAKEDSQLLKDTIYSAFDDYGDFEIFLEERGYDSEEFSNHLDSLAITKAYIKSLYQDISSGVSATEKEIKEYYEDNPINYDSSRSINIIHISEERKANSIYDEILGEDISFDEAMDRYNQEPEVINLLSLRDVYYNELSETLAEAVFQLNEGDISQVIEYDNMYYIIQCFQLRKGENIPFEKIKDQVKEDFLKEKKESLYREYIENEIKSYEIEL